MRAEESLKLPPACKRNVVVGGDAFDEDPTEQPRKRGTNSVALSVGEFEYVCVLCVAVGDYQKHPRTLFRYNEVHLKVTNSVNLRSLIYIYPAVFFRTPVVTLPATFSMVPSPEQEAL